MTLAERLSEYVRACFTGIWVQSFEHDDAIVEIARLCRQQRWSLATWDIDRGSDSRRPRRGLGHRRRAPRTRWLPSRQSARWPRQEGTALLVLRNFHRFLGSIEVVQALDTAIAAGKQNRTILVVLSPGPPDPERAGAPVRRHRARSARLESSSSRSPARSPPSPVSCPTTMASAPCSMPRLGSPGSRPRMRSRSR